MTFTPTNWNTSQSVVLVAGHFARVGDGASIDFYGYRGARTGTVSVSIVSAPGDNTPTDTPTPTGTPTNTHTPNFSFTSSLHMDARNGATASFTVSLWRQPGINLTMEIRSGNPAAFSTNPNSLTFTPDNWATPQTVRVTIRDITRARLAGDWLALYPSHNLEAYIVRIYYLATPMPSATPLPGNTPLHTNTPTPGSENGDRPQPENTPTHTAPATPTRPGAPPHRVKPPAPGIGGESGEGDGSASEEAWVAPGMVKHAAAPAQVSGSGPTHHFYFTGPGGVRSGPIVPSVRELAQKHPKGSPVVTLFVGVNPLTGRAVRIEYLPSEEKILYTTAYEDKYYKRDKPYIFTIDKDGKVTHREW